MVQHQDSVIDLIIQSRKSPEILIPITLRHKNGELKHFKMNCEVKYDDTYIQKSALNMDFRRISISSNIPLPPSQSKKFITSHGSRLDRVELRKKEEKGPLQILCYLRDDVDKLKLLTEERCNTKATRSQETFIRRVFHKLRTPLHVICNSLGVNEVTLEELSEVRYHAGTYLLHVNYSIFHFY